VELRSRGGVPDEKTHPPLLLSSLIIHVFHQIMKFSLILLITVWATVTARSTAALKNGCGCNDQEPACAPTCPCQTATGFCQDWDDADAKTCDQQQVCDAGREKTCSVWGSLRQSSVLTEHTAACCYF
jgi:hypothetical protein